MVQVFGRCEFAGSVALKAQDGVVRRHTAAVVNDLDQSAAGIGHYYLYIRCSSIYRILHQLLYHGGRPLNNLPRSNHICDIFG